VSKSGKNSFYKRKTPASIYEEGVFCYLIQHIKTEDHLLRFWLEVVLADLMKYFPGKMNRLLDGFRPKDLVYRTQFR
jgi:hypothetical protein